MRQGFTLLELSIVLLLIAIVIGGGLAITTSALQASQYNVTVARMDAIEKDLLDYAIAHNRIPCPSDLTQPSSSVTYGLEAGTNAGGTGTGECVTGMTPAANFKATSGAEEGGVPTRALQLPDDYMYDGWGRRFRYAVDPTVTAAGALPYPKGGLCTASLTGITVKDASGTARTTAGIYALISHGANGHGAYTSSGNTFSDGSVNADELTNCHCNSGGWAQTYTPNYVEKVPMQDAANAVDNFDDIVTFKEGWQMQAVNYPLASAKSCPMLAVSTTTSPYIYLYSFNAGNLTALPAPSFAPGGAAYRVSFTQDNSQLAFYSKDGKVYFYSVARSGLTLHNSIAQAGSDGSNAYSAFSPDSSSTYLAVSPAYLPGIGVYKISGGTYGTTGVTVNNSSVTTLDGYWAALDWSPDSSTLYLNACGPSSGYCNMYVYGQSGGSFSVNTTINWWTVNGNSNVGTWDVAAHPGGGYVAIGQQDGLWLFKTPLTSNPAISTSISPSYDGFMGIAWSPDGAFLAASGYNNGFYPYSFNASSQSFAQASTSGANCAGDAGSKPAWTVDGDYVMVAGNGTPTLCLYQRSGTTFTNMNLPSSVIPTGTATAVAFTH